MHTLIIAEIGSAWRFGSHPSVNALQAIDVAKDCGADCVKFQFCSDPRQLELRRNVPFGSYDILAWPAGWLQPIADAAKEHSIELMCTVFLREDVAVLDPFVKRWKVASLENQYDELFSAMRSTGKDIIASHGATAATKWSDRLGDFFLHCTAAYPASLADLNLLAIKTGCYDGYSDHSCHVLTGALAVACGAELVEVHFRLDGTPQDNPDYKHSHTPQGLSQYIDNIRVTELMLGDGVKRVMPCEVWALKHKVKT